MAAFQEEPLLKCAESFANVADSDDSPPLTLRLAPNYNACDVRGLDKNQDYACCGRVEKLVKEESFDWFVGCDGHGADHFINILKRAKWDEIMAASDSFKDLIRYTTKYKFLYGNSGATYCQAKMFHNRVETCTVGDSQIAVFIDKQLAYISTPHKWSNPLEKERLKLRIDEKKVVVQKCAPIPEIFGTTKLRLREGEYIHFENLEIIAITQSLGHNDVTGYCPEKNVVFFSPGQEVSVVGGSDGLWEMVNTEGPDAESDMLFLASKSANEIADMAEARWKQEWDFHWTDAAGVERVAPNSFTNKNEKIKSSGYDDVSVCKWSNVVI